MKKYSVFLFVGIILLSYVTICPAAPVQEPVFLKQIKWTGTSWFGSPIIHNLGSGNPKLIGTYYDIYVWDHEFNELDSAPSGSSEPHQGRIYPPAVCADLEGDGTYEIVVASNAGKVAAYEWKNNQLSIKNGWPAIACNTDPSSCPEVRGMAAGDLDGDGTVEIVVTNTETDSDGAQVFVFSHDGSLYQPPGLSYNAWPRYNTATGTGNDADANGYGNHGYGCYGLNVGLGNLNDDDNLEIVVTFDNHQINVFYHDGVSMLASPYFTNRSSSYSGNRLNWGQFIRWFDPQVEEDHYHLHIGDWPHPDNQKWMQWTDSPPNVADINGDGKNEVVGVANVEKDVPYDTKHHSIMVLEGSYGDGSRSARRLAGWENLPSSGYPLDRSGHTWYPPNNPPAPTIVNLVGDSRPEILYGAHDGYIYCTSPSAAQLWRKDIRHGRALMYASEIMVADLNQDDTPELILTTFGDPDNLAPDQPHGYLMILDNNGTILHDVELPEQGTNGNGKGAPAAPTVMDLNGDGNLEVVVQTFGVGCFIYTIPGSAENLLVWPTGRGNYLRDGQPWSGQQLAVPPQAATLLEPNGTVDQSRPTFTWEKVSGSTWYYLWVNDSAGNPLIKEWCRASEVVNGAECSISSSESLSDGSYTWWIRTYNSYGHGPWSSGMQFSVDPPDPPGPTTLDWPTGTIVESAPVFSWSAVTDSTWYYLWVDGPSGDTILREWYRSSDVADGGLCSINPQLSLTNGTYKWWVKTYNGNGHGPWSSAMTFLFDSTVSPVKATLVSPSGATGDADPTYCWDRDGASTWYQLWVNDSSGTTKVKQWYRSEVVCSGSSCSVTPAQSLANGNHRWWIRTWNENATGPWSDAVNFTVE